MLHWLFCNWLKETYYHSIINASEEEAEAFFPKYQDYWAYVSNLLATIIVQCLTLFYFHIFNAVVLLVWCYVFA
jgi:hypothetical protein